MKFFLPIHIFENQLVFILLKIGAYPPPIALTDLFSSISKDFAGTISCCSSGFRASFIERSWPSKVLDSTIKNRINPAPGAISFPALGYLFY